MLPAAKYFDLMNLAIEKRALSSEQDKVLRSFDVIAKYHADLGSPIFGMRLQPNSMADFVKQEAVKSGYSYCVSEMSCVGEVVLFSYEDMRKDRV